MRSLRIGILTLAALAGSASLIAICSNPSSGPDVTVAELIDISRYTSSPVDGVHAYALGTESLNIGDADIHWIAGSPAHPVIAQNIYRLKTDVTRPGGRLEQVGMSWLKHGFTALAGTEFCTSCTFESGHSSGAWLGMGCEDPYWAGLNGSRPLGMRSEVNATSGVFPYPFTQVASPQADDQRIRVAVGDLEANSGNPDLRYFAEGQYIAADDAQAGNGRNNATYREIVLDASMDFAFGGSLGGYPGQQRQEAIRAWKRVDDSVQITRVDYTENFLPARFNVAAKVFDNGNGTWRYEWAVHNLNSHRSAQALEIPVPSAALVTGIGFHDIDHHSGEPYAATDWVSSTGSEFVRWEGETYASNPNANALRWGTMFNYWFDSDQPPGTGTATLTLFRDGGLGEPAALEFQTIVPGAGCLFCDAFESGDALRWSAGS